MCFTLRSSLCVTSECFPNESPSLMEVGAVNCVTFTWQVTQPNTACPRAGFILVLAMLVLLLHRWQSQSVSHLGLQIF